MAIKRKENESQPSIRENSLAIEIGRIAKLFALYLFKDTKDEALKINRLNAVGFSVPEIAILLGKTESNVRVQISQAKSKKAK